MPVQPTYPGVYIQEQPSGVHTITGVATSDTAFVGAARRGVTGTPIAVQSVAEFTRNFGTPWDRDHPLAHAVGHFFANGGAKAIIVRVAAAGAVAASADLADATPATVLTLTARGEGLWAQRTGAVGLSATVDYDATSNPADLFNLVVELRSVDPRSGESVVEVSETFANLSMATENARYAPNVIAFSQLVTVEAPAVAAPATPGASTSDTLPANIPGTTPNFNLRLAVDGGPATELTVTPVSTSRAEVVNGINAALAAAGIGASAAFSGNKLAITSTGTDIVNTSVVVTPAQVNDGSGKLKIGLAFGGLETSGAASLRPVEKTTGFGGAKEGGTDAGQTNGIVTAAEAVPADQEGGIYSLSQLTFPRFNLLCVPDVPATEASIAATAINNAALTAAMSYCRTEHAFLLVDTPRDPVADTNWTVSPPALGALPALGEYGAVYYPRVTVLEPGASGNTVTVDLPPCGAVAGVMARTDVNRGVWKAPAGLESGIVGVSGLSVLTDDDVSGELNPRGVNVLRTFAGAGMVVWGARTLKGDDSQSSDFKYVPVRRLTNYIESSLYIGTQFAVFEPNDEDLWGQLRLAVGTFMRTLFRQGAFQQSAQRSEKDSFFVVCDDSVNPQSEIDQGRVNVVVGFAPLKPAEFVIITITQISNLET